MNSSWPCKEPTTHLVAREQNDPLLMQTEAPGAERDAAVYAALPASRLTAAARARSITANTCCSLSPGTLICSPSAVLMAASKSARTTSPFPRRERRDHSRLSGNLATGPVGTLQVIAVGGPGAEALLIARSAFTGVEPLAAWISPIGQGDHRRQRDAHDCGTGNRRQRRTGIRSAAPWTCPWHCLRYAVDSGTARLLGQEPAYRVGSPPVPLASRLWVEAAEPNLQARELRPAGPATSSGAPWTSSMAAPSPAIRDIPWRAASSARSQRLVRRNELTATLSFETFERLSALIVRRPDRRPAASYTEDPTAGGLPTRRR